MLCDVDVMDCQVVGRFVSLMDFASRVDLRKGGIRSLQSMAKAGAFDEICSRDEAVSSVKSYLEASEQKFKSKESAVMEMFAEQSDLKVSGYKLQKFSESEKLKMELESLNTKLEEKNNALNTVQSEQNTTADELTSKIKSLESIQFAFGSLFVLKNNS